jgi:hypothetical protein
VARIAHQSKRAGPPARHRLDSSEAECEGGGKHELAAVGGPLDLLLGRISHHLGMSEFNQCREERLAREM